MSDGPQAVLRGLGTYLPPDVLTNDDLARVLDTSDEWIVSRTGIHRRHVSAPGTPTSDLAVAAGRRALDASGLTAVDAVVLATTTPDRACPGTAPVVADRLGLGPVPAFDVSAACTGFVYGLMTATGMLRGGLAATVLMIGADTFTSTLDPADRSTRALIGDGAGAVVLGTGEPGEPGALLDFHLGSDGSRVDALQVPATSAAQRAGAPADNYFTMDGRTVFSHAVIRMTESVRELTGRIGWEPGMIDHLVPHQANVRILDAVADQLGLEPDRTVVNLGDVGNTVAASIPLALADASADGRLKPGHRTVLTGFGAGLTWGTTALEWPSIAVVDG